MCEKLSYFHGEFQKRWKGEGVSQAISVLKFSIDRIYQQITLMLVLTQSRPS